MSRKYNVGDILESKEYGRFKVIHIKTSLEVTIEFLNSGNRKVVRAGDMMNGFVTDEFKYRVLNKYKVGDIVSTKSSGDVVVIDMIKSTKILIKFVDSGFSKFVTASSLERGSIRDDSKLKYKKLSVGDLFDTKNYGKIEILSVPSSTEAVVRFVETGYVVRTRPSEITKGEIKDPTSDKFKPKIRKDDRFCVYLHKDKDGIVRYVGQGVESRAFVFTGRNKRWEDFFSQDNTPSVEVVATNLNKDDAHSLELEFINKYNNTIVNSIKTKHSYKEMLFEDFASNFKYDESSPTFLTRKLKSGQYVVAGFKTSNYYKVSLNNSSYGVHRVIWLLHNGSIDKNMVIDHIDNNPSNNNINNLRMVSPSENSKNRFLRLPKSGFRNILEEYDSLGNVKAYRVSWKIQMRDKSCSKHFSISKYSNSERLALFAAYEFRDSLIARGELSHKIKEGEKEIEQQ